MVEIERKFLIKGDFKEYAHKHERISQGYIVTNSKGRSVRIRIKGDKGYITIKGAGNDAGTTRFEWEKEIPLSEAEQLMHICDPGTIDKIRYEIKAGSHLYEVDEFHGENEGLIMAEIELQSENEIFEKPKWLGDEVTGDERYYNAYLSQHPYSTWENSTKTD